MSPFADAITTALVHSLWQDSLVAGLLWMTLIALRHRPANVRYAAGCVAVGLMALLPIATAVVFYMQAPAPETVLRATVGTARAIAATPFTAPVVWAGHDLQRTTWLATVQAWALPVWAVGMFLCSLRLVCGGAHAMLLRWRGEPADEPLRSMVARLARRTGVERSVQVLVSTLADGPGTLGWLRPVILLPPATIVGLTPQQLEAVLAHELAHIRRHDYLVNVLQMLVETLLFYHPAVWWASRRVRVERELCCDDVAVGSCGDALCYAQALTALASPRVTTASMAMGATHGPLVQRIERLLGVTTTRDHRSQWPVLLALFLALASGVLDVTWVSAHAAQDAVQAQSTTGAQFEIVSIKRNTAGRAAGGGMGSRPDGSFTMTNQPISSILRNASPTPVGDVEGLPSWVNTEAYDINAKAPAGSTRGQEREMMGNMLRERMKVTAHVEQREQNTFALVVARSDGRLGPQLKPSTLDCSPTAAGGDQPPAPDDRKDGCTTAMRPGTIRSGSITMDQLVRSLPGFAGGQVTNRTGLDGRYELTLHFALPGLAAAPSAVDDAPQFSTAIEEQLGLKLRPEKSEVPILVIDHIERPTEN